MIERSRVRLLSPDAALFGQQPCASCSHLMCLCSPSSITWYLARAFMLMRRNVAAGIGSNKQGEYCRSALQRSDRKEPRYKWPTLLYFLTGGNYYQFVWPPVVCGKFVTDASDERVDCLNGSVRNQRSAAPCRPRMRLARKLDTREELW